MELLNFIHNLYQSLPELICFKMCLAVVFITGKCEFIGHMIRSRGGRKGTGFSLGVRLVRSLQRLRIACQRYSALFLLVQDVHCGGYT
jgi:hypothetical protein